MPDFRVFCIAPPQGASELTLTADESHHLVVVNRARVGDPVIAFDGRGREWECELTNAKKSAATLRIRTARTARALPAQITLGQALPKGATMDTIVRKATEIGAAVIAPLETERTQVHLAADRSDRKIEKWHVAAIEAAKQCGNPFLPEIRPVQSLADFLRATQSIELKLIASLHPGAKSLKQVLADARAERGRAPGTAAWLIGPEGDFSPAEIEAALAAGFQPITLGPLVLRSDTAATYALSVLSYELSNG